MKRQSSHPTAALAKIAITDGANPPGSTGDDIANQSRIGSAHENRWRVANSRGRCIGLRPLERLVDNTAGGRDPHGTPAITSIERAALLQVLLLRFEESLEIGFAKAVLSTAFDNFEEYWPNLALRETLKQNFLRRRPEYWPRLSACFELLLEARRFRGSRGFGLQGRARIH